MESVMIRTGGYTDADGNYISGGTVTLEGCDVSPAGEGRIDAVDIDGNTRKLQVLAPPGASVEEGDILVIRGLEYRVTALPFDWSIGRQPWNPRHRTKLQIICERGEG